MFSQLQKAIRERCRSTNNVHKRRRIDLGDLSQTKSDTTKSLCNVLCDIEGVPLLKQPAPTTQRAWQKKSSPAKKQESMKKVSLQNISNCTCVIIQTALGSSYLHAEL